MSIKPKVTPLLVSELGTGTSETKYSFGTKKTFQASGFTSAGAGAVDVVIEASNDESLPFVSVGTISLTLSTTPVADGFASDAAWKFWRARVDSISGTDAEVTVNMGAIGIS